MIWTVPFPTPQSHYLHTSVVQLLLSALWSKAYDLDSSSPNSTITWLLTQSLLTFIQLAKLSVWMVRGQIILYLQSLIPNLFKSERTSKIELGPALAFLSQSWICYPRGFWFSDCFMQRAIQGWITNIASNYCLEKWIHDNRIQIGAWLVELFSKHVHLKNNRVLPFEFSAVFFYWNKYKY